ncbi:class F sortase [Paenibacillus sp. Marseille-Q4541]|uniref:class F sortase n=1 Tax=Paenibacillus sp. Marseille-Q4541 TaxID=2831522 RepID=UPI001BAD23FE|nr:class F sortase [Paenibacillus sp. Marseille-Q4541]
MERKQTLIGLALVFLLLTACGHSNDHNINNITPKSSSSINEPLPVKEIDQKEELKEQALDEQKNEFIIPDQLWIPSVGLKAPVEPVGLLENGQLEVPVSSKVAGVFVEGVLPGQPGNALMAGHVDNYKGPAIFYPLKKVKPGDPVVLSDKEGKYLVFSVIAVESYLTAEAPLEKIFGNTDKEQLNLITCTGIYNRKKGEHEKRLVVYTRLLK